LFLFILLLAGRRLRVQNLVNATDFGKHAGKVSPEGVHFVLEFFFQEHNG
jgi:hypothetical protein